VRYALAPMGIVSSAVSLPPWTVTSARPDVNRLKTSYGPLHSFFAFYALIGFRTTASRLVCKYSRCGDPMGRPSARSPS